MRCCLKPDADITAFEYPDELLGDAKENGCDIAFLDIHMSEMTGVELAKELKAVNPKMNIIFVTGFSEYAGDAMELHASGYIMKPVTKEKVERELCDLRFPIVPKKDALLRVQCFGNFDVFLPNGSHMRFERSRSKEIFAYLVHPRRGKLPRRCSRTLLSIKNSRITFSSLYMLLAKALKPSALKKRSSEAITRLP